MSESNTIQDIEEKKSDSNSENGKVGICVPKKGYIKRFTIECGDDRFTQLTMSIKIPVIMFEIPTGDDLEFMCDAFSEIVHNYYELKRRETDKSE